MRCHLALLTIILLFSQGIFAAQNDGIPVSADPGRINLQNNQLYAPQPTAPTKVKIEKEEASKPLLVDKKAVSITLKKVTLTGMKQHALPLEVYTIIKAHIGKNYTLKGLQALSELIEQTLRSSGYILAQVVLPPQKITQGTVTFRIYPGYVSQITIQGKPKVAGYQLRWYLDQIEDRKPLTLSVLEHYLLLANNIPGITIKTALTPSKTAVGASDLVVQVTTKKFNAFVNYNNRLTDYFGNSQTLESLSMNNFIGADRISVTAGNSLPSTDNMQYVSVSYLIQLGPWGTQFFYQGSETNTQPSGRLNSFNLKGLSKYNSFSISQPLIVARNGNLSVYAVLYHLSSKNELSQLNTLSYYDRITAWNFGGNLTWVWWHGQDKINISLTQGVPWFGGETRPAEPSRASGRGVFTKWNFDLQRIQYITQNLSLVIHGVAQYTRQRLLASEQIGYGGMPFGLAFDYSTIAGDRGAEGITELRYALPQFIPSVHLLQPFIYYDYGVVLNNISGPDIRDRQDGASWGGGVNFQIAQHLQGNLVVAEPLIRDRSEKNTRDPQFFFSVTAFY